MYYIKSMYMKNLSNQSFSQYRQGILFLFDQATSGCCRMRKSTNTFLRQPPFHPLLLQVVPID